MDSLCRFSSCFHKEGKFVTSCLFSFLKRSALKGKNLLPNSLFSEQNPIQKEKTIILTELSPLNVHSFPLK